MPETARRIVLASRPVGEPKPSDFRLEEFPVPQPGPGQMLLRTKWLSLDPYMRGRMSDAPSYAKPVGIDEVIEAGTVSEVAASNNDRYQKGDIVLSRAGWQTHVLSDGSGLRKLDPAARAGLDRARRARHAGHDRLHRAAARSAQPQGGRDGRGLGRLRRGRLGGRADREDQGRARGRHRGRAGQVPIRQGRARLRRLRRSSRSGDLADAAEGRLPEGHRRLFRECRLAGVGCGVPAAQYVRAHSGVRADRAVQHDRAAARARTACRSCSAPC